MIDIDANFFSAFTRQWAVIAIMDELMIDSMQRLFDYAQTSMRQQTYCIVYIYSFLFDVCRYQAETGLILISTDLDVTFESERRGEVDDSTRFLSDADQVDTVPVFGPDHP